jgi:hypothetical protein
MITQTRTPGRQPLNPGVPFIKGVCAGPTVSHDPFSDGEVSVWISVQEVPVEMVPILSTIFFLNRYFWKRAVLNGKKPAHLAAFLWA